MLRFFAGVISTLLLVSAGFFLWKSRAEQEVQIPAAPQPAVYSTPSAAAAAAEPSGAARRRPEVEGGEALRPRGQGR
jgi:hypothetical protein